MKKPKRKTRYVSYDCIDICGALEQGDKIAGMRYKNREPVEVIYIIQHKPVFHSYSGNWALRCHSRKLLDKEENLTEYLYINPESIKKYKFNFELVEKLKREREMQRLIQLSKQKPYGTI